MRDDVRRPVHAGSQMVRALWFDCALHGEAAARARLLACWESGARAYRVHDGYLLEWKAARRMPCERAPGLPLCEQDGVLASAPLLAHERAGIAAGGAVLVLGARLHACALAPAQRIDPSLWLGLSAIPVCGALSMPRGPAAGFVASAPPPAPDARAVLGRAVPAPSAERAEFLRRLQQAQRGEGRRGDALHTGVRVLGVAALAAAALAGSVGGLLLLPRLLLRGRGAAAGGRPAARTRPAPARDWLGTRLASLAMLTRLSKVFGWRQANYIRRLVRQFEQGDLEEALRHAIPVDSPALNQGPSFGVPGRRGTLEVRTPHAGAASIGLDPASLNFLRATYQRSFDQLDRAGRIDEATFVLAELMNRRQEAVDYLERKGRIDQAARLAETLALAPAVLVRLHCMAGDVERAVLVARLTDSFGEAVAELERRQHREAATLRLEWAQVLAARGSLVEAAHAVWPLRAEHERALAWLRTAQQAGGSLGVQALLSKLVLDPDARRSDGAAVQALLFAPGDEAARQRMRAGDSLLGLDKHNDATHRLAGELWRRLLIDRAAGLNAIPPDRLKRLQALAADPVLNADVPNHTLARLPAGTPLQGRASPLRLAFAERGLLPLADVRRLPDGGYLLALGEGGIVQARQDGSTLPRFPVPAHHLVLAHGGRRALALARREKIMRVGRLDLLDRKAADWFSARLDFWAGAYDGTSWSVVAEQRLMALDTAAAGQSVLWQVRELPGRVTGFEHEDGVEAMLVDTGAAVEQWRYALPQRRLLGRDRIAIEDGVYAILPDCRNVTARPLALSAFNAQQQTATLVLPSRHGGRDASLALQWIGAPPLVTLHAGLLLLRFGAADGWHGQLIDLNGRILADVTLPDAQEAQAALHDGHLLVWDRCGRLVDVDTATSDVRMLTFG